MVGESVLGSGYVSKEIFWREYTMMSMRICCSEKGEKRIFFLEFKFPHQF